MNDPIIYGREPLGPRVVSVAAMEDYKLDIAFDNGERRMFDAKPLLVYPAFAALENRAFFETVHVAYGSIAWPGDIDYCPDTLYMQSVPWPQVGGRAPDRAVE